MQTVENSTFPSVWVYLVLRAVYTVLLNTLICNAELLVCTKKEEYLDLSSLLDKIGVRGVIRLSGFNIEDLFKHLLSSVGMFSLLQRTLTQTVIHWILLSFPGWMSWTCGYMHVVHAIYIWTSNLYYFFIWNVIMTEVMGHAFGQSYILLDKDIGC